MDMHGSSYWEKALMSLADEPLAEAAEKLGRELTAQEEADIIEAVEEQYADKIEELAFELAVGAAESRFEGDR